MNFTQTLTCLVFPFSSCISRWRGNKSIACLDMCVGVPLEFKLSRIDDSGSCSLDLKDFSAMGVGLGRGSSD